MDGIFKNSNAQGRARNRVVFERLRRGECPKSIATHIGLKGSHIYQHIIYLDYAPVYLSRDERNAIKKMRQFDNVTYEDHTRTIG